MSDELVRIAELSAAVGRPVHWLRRQADAGRIPSVRTAGGHRRFNIPDVRRALAVPSNSATAYPRDDAPQWTRELPLPDLEEHVVWLAIADELSIDRTAPAGRVVQYAFTEMLNNAIDHSRGTRVSIEFWTTPRRHAFRIIDDGIGVFENLRAGLDLPDQLAAVQELTKGKRTTMADRHSGEGIFFTSKAVDLFQLSSGGLRWTVDNLRADYAVGSVDHDRGTTVAASIDARSTRELREVFDRYTVDYEFVRTRPVIALFGLNLPFVSRSEAKRVAAGLEEFREVDLDFTGVTDVGQGFVDELFRVWARQHPTTRLIPVHMNEAVEFMVRRAAAAADQASADPARSEEPTGREGRSGSEPPYGIEP